MPEDSNGLKDSKSVFQHHLKNYVRNAGSLIVTFISKHHNK